MTTRGRWTDRDVAIARDHLKRAVSLADACSGLSQELGRKITRDSLEGACRRAGFNALTMLRKPEPANTVDDRVSDEERIQQLVKLTRNGVSLEALCDKLDMAPARVRDLIVLARGDGYTIDLAGSHVGHRPSAVNDRSVDVAIARADKAGEHKFAVASDLHFGSKYHLGPQLVDFIDLAYEKGCRQVFLPGDLLEGCYRHARWELTHHGWHDQSTFFAETLPRKKGLHYFAITGNHDETFEKEIGLDIVHAMGEVFRTHKRDDLTMLGARGATVRLAANPTERGLFVELWHPLGSPAYALSYKLQKKVEKYGAGQKPDMLFAGHWHQQVYFTARGIHCFAAGTFQGGGGPFGTALGGHPSIGGWIVRYAQTPDGTVRHVLPEWVSYFERECVRDLPMTA